MLVQKVGVVGMNRHALAGAMLDREYESCKKQQKELVSDQKVKEAESEFNLQAPAGRLTF